MKTIVPNKDKAYAAVEEFHYADWSDQLRRFLGNSGETMIAQEEKERKYDKSTHPARFQKIKDNWDTILKIIDEELPSADELSKIMDTIGIS